MGRAENFQVDLGGILELLSEHLYSSADVFVRELIQNGVDAIGARAAAEGGYEGRIRFEPDKRAGTLTVIDDGIGLTGDEARSFLSRVGASIKRREGGERSSYIGQFGVGILSCFMVADEIVVLTRRFGEDSNGIRWTAHSDGTFRIEELADPLEVGTRVVLRLNKGGSRYAGPRVVRELVERYARYLPVPIFIGNGRSPVNENPAPWDFDLSDEGERQFVVQSFMWETGLQPLDVLDLSDSSIGLRGVAYVLPELPANAAQQHHEVFVKRMFVTNRPGDLLPRWAGFTRCVLSSDRLRPTASRESLYEDRMFRAVRKSVTQRLRGYLDTLSRENRAVLATLLEYQDTAFRQLAREDDAFFDSVIDLLSFESSLGRMSFRDFRREHHIVRVTQTTDQFRSMSAIAAARGTVLFNGGYTHHEELLEKAVARDPSLSIEPLDGRDLIEQLADAPEAVARRFAAIEDAANEVLAPFGAKARLSEFEPSDLPAIYGESSNSNLARSLRAAREMSQGLMTELLDAASDGINPDDEQAILCLNAANPVVRSLLLASDPRLTASTTTLLYVQALMLSQQPLTSDETQAFSAALAEVLDRVGAEHRSQAFGRDRG